MVEKDSNSVDRKNSRSGGKTGRNRHDRREINRHWRRSLFDFAANIFSSAATNFLTTVTNCLTAVTYFLTVSRLKFWPPRQLCRPPTQLTLIGAYLFIVLFPVSLYGDTLSFWYPKKFWVSKKSNPERILKNHTSLWKVDKNIKKEFTLTVSKPLKK